MRGRRSSGWRKNERTKEKGMRWDLVGGGGAEFNTK